MKVFKAFVEVSTTAISLASIIFMGFVFFNEFQGRGVLYIEPNRAIAFTEFLMTVFGFAGTLGLWLRRLGR